jgi:hypothetical protein
MTSDEKEYLRLKIEQYKLLFGLFSTLFILNCGGYGFIVSKNDFFETNYWNVLLILNTVLSFVIISGLITAYKKITFIINKFR